MAEPEVLHDFECIIADDETDDPNIVNPSNWNAGHVISGLVGSDDLASTAEGLEGARMVGYQLDDTVYHMIDDMLNRGILHGLVITDQGGLNITWTEGDILDRVTGKIIEVDAQVTNVALTDNAINYLLWKTGTTLEVSLADAASGECHIARIDTFNGNIHTIRQNEYLNSVISSTRRCLRAMFPLVVLTGMLVSAKAGGSAWDVVSSLGGYVEEGHVYIPVAGIDSTVTDLVRLFHVASAWSSDTAAVIDSTKWDNGTGLVAVTANKYYKSMFLIGDDGIHWIYPQAEHATESQAIAGPLPTAPPGLAMHVPSVAVVLRGNATGFPVAGSEAWIDIRPRLGGNLSQTISDHSSLANLDADDHTQYHNDTRGDLRYSPLALSTGISGSSGHISKFTGTQSLADSIIHEDTGKIGINCAPAVTLDVLGDIGYTGQTYLAPTTDPASAKMFSMTPYGDVASGKFNITYGWGVFAGSARRDRLFSWGYNQLGSGAKELAGEASLAYALESFYSPSEGVEYCETYINYISNDGSKSYRPIMFSCERNTGIGNALMTFTMLQMFDAVSGLQNYKFDTIGQWIYGTGLGIYKIHNNQTFLYQMNAAGDGYVNILKVNASDQVEYGSNVKFLGQAYHVQYVNINLPGGLVGPGLTISNDTSGAIAMRIGGAASYYDFARTTATGYLDISGSQVAPYRGITTNCPVVIGYPGAVVDAGYKLVVMTNTVEAVKIRAWNYTAAQQVGFDLINTGTANAWWQIYIPASSANLNVWCPSGDIMAITTTGTRLGVAAGGVGGKLEISGNSGSSHQLHLHSGADTLGFLMGRRVTNDAFIGWMEFYAQQSGYGGFLFHNVDGYRICIGPTGYIGIGMTTTGPGCPLHVKGTSNGSATVVIQNDTTNDPCLRIGHTSYHYSFDRATWGYLHVEGNQAGYTGYCFNGPMVVGSTSAMLDAIETGSHFQVIAAVGSTNLLVQEISAGTNTAAALRLACGATSSNQAPTDWLVQALGHDFAHRFRIYGNMAGSEGEYFTIIQGGNVGIGATAPVSLLEVQGGLTTTGAILTLGTKETSVVVNDILGRINFYAPLDAAGSDANLLAASIVAIAEDTFSTTVNKTSLQFRTGASEVATTKMTILSDGSVGLGVTDPDEQLEITGRIHLGQTTAPGTTTDKLYNVSGVLTWNGSPVISDASVQSTTGWISAGETWTYASADDPTYTLTVPTDLTGKYQAGQRVKLTQTTVKYFIITKVAYSSPNTTLTLYGGTDYDLADAAISLNFYSREKIPFGFPLDHEKWTVLVTDTSTRTQASPTVNVWYNIGTTNAQISVPIGKWLLSYNVCAYADGASTQPSSVCATLSTANNSESDSTMTGRIHVGTTNTNMLGMIYRERYLDVTTKTTYYLNGMSRTNPTDSINWYNLAGDGPMVIKAVCAYL